MILEIYIDESGQTKSRYLVLGGLILPLDAVASANEALWSLRVPELPQGEMKWGKVSRSKLPAYRRVIDGFFDHPAFTNAHFHSLVVDTTKLNHNVFNGGSADVGFNKEIYQLASKCARLYPQADFHVYPDFRSTNQQPEDLRQMLNMGRRKVYDEREWPFRRCHFRDSKNTPLLWLADLMSGAIGYHLNGHIKAESASAHKSELARHIMGRARVPNPALDTAMSGKFTIWHRRYSEAGSVPRR